MNRVHNSFYAIWNNDFTGNRKTYNPYKVSYLMLCRRSTCKRTLWDAKVQKLKETQSFGLKIITLDIQLWSVAKYSARIWNWRNRRDFNPLKRSSVHCTDLKSFIFHRPRCILRFEWIWGYYKLKTILFPKIILNLNSNNFAGLNVICLLFFHPRLEDFMCPVRIFIFLSQKSIELICFYVKRWSVNITSRSEIWIYTNFSQESYKIQFLKFHSSS